MAISTGTERRRAGVVSWIGMVAALVLPVGVWIYIIVGGMVANGTIGDAKRSQGGVDGYNWVEQPISHLGDHSDGVATAFTVMNLVTAVLFVAAAVAVKRRVPLAGDVVLGFILIALATVVLAFARCTEGVELAGGEIVTQCDGDRVDLVHLAAAFFIALMIVLVPAAGARHFPRAGLYSLARPISRWAWKAALAAVIFFVFLRFRLDLIWWEFDLNRNVDDAFDRWDLANLDGVAERAIWVVGYGWLLLIALIMLWRWQGEKRSVFDVSHVQDGVLYGSRRWTEVEILGVKLDDPGGFRAWLQSGLESGLIRAEQTRPRRLPDEPDFAVTVLLTRSGLEKLGQGYSWQAENTVDAFGMGADKRAVWLGDVGDSSPDQWEDTWRTHTDAVLWVRATTGKLWTIRRRIGKVGQDESPESLARCNPITKDGRFVEHFGFADGISSTWVEHIHPLDDPARRGGGKFTGKKFEPLALGEFILGEVDESRDIFPVPEPVDFYDRGTFVVLRKLKQDVAAFERLCATLARSTNAPDESDLSAEGNGQAGQQPSELDSGAVARLLVGRRFDGSSLAVDREDADPNFFTYGNDPEGFGCPVGAHVRRANPRDSLGFDGILSHRHRMLRRGMTYGPRYKEGSGNEDDDRGLLFVGINVRIAEQFEFVQRAWLNDGAAFGLATNPDPIAGSWPPNHRETHDEGVDAGVGTRSIVVPGRPPIVANLDRPLITTCGAVYTFAPSMHALRDLARGRVFDRT